MGPGASFPLRCFLQEEPPKFLSPNVTPQQWAWGDSGGSTVQQRHRGFSKRQGTAKGRQDPTSPQARLPGGARSRRPRPTPTPYHRRGAAGTYSGSSHSKAESGAGWSRGRGRGVPSPGADRPGSGYRNPPPGRGWGRGRAPPPPHSRTSPRRPAARAGAPSLGRRRHPRDGGEGPVPRPDRRPGRGAARCPKSSPESARRAASSR